MPDLTGQVCTKCGERKPLSEYTRMSKVGEKRDARCKACVRAIQRANPKKLKRNIAWDKAQRQADTAWAKERRAKSMERKTARRQQVAATRTENIRPARIFARDNFTCQLCKTEIDMQAKWPDPLSRSLDHKVPLSKGGAHTYDNIQAAHLQCNISKNDRLLSAA